MPNQVQVMMDQDVYDSLQMLMVPPINDVSSAIRALLKYEGHASPAAVALGAAGQHFSMAEELERANSGIYEGGGAS